MCVIVRDAVPVLYLPSVGFVEMVTMFEPAFFEVGLLFATNVKRLVLLELL